MRTQDAIMLGLYMLVFAAGIEMAVNGETLGYVQIAVISVLAPLRISVAIKRARKM